MCAAVSVVSAANGWCSSGAIWWAALKDTPLAEGFSIRTLAEQAEGLSGSDLKELCRNAAMRPMREFMREVDGDHEKLSQSQKEVRVLFVLGHHIFRG